MSEKPEIKNREEKRLFLKFTMRQALDNIRIALLQGKIIMVYEELMQIREEFARVFPFRYGTDMEDEDYKEEEVL